MGSIIKSTRLLALAAAACMGEGAWATNSQVVDGVTHVVNSADDVSIYYRIYGRGDPAVVLIHGWSCNATYWDAQVEALKTKYTVLTIDLAGHGDSGRNRRDWSMGNFGEDVAATVRQLPNQHVVLVGHSMGGLVMLEAAQRLDKRVLGVIGVDTLKNIGEPPRTPAQVEEIMAPYRADFVSHVRRTVTGEFPATTDSRLVRRIGEDQSRAPPEIALPAGEAALRFDINTLMRDLKIPIVLINAAYTGATDEARMHTVVPELRAVILDGVGHFPMIEQPQRFNSILLREIASMAVLQGAERQGVRLRSKASWKMEAQ